MIKQQLEGAFPRLFVQGEISNLRVQSSGHIYFSLKDAGAQISAVMFRGPAARLAQKPADGAQVIVTGEINLYPPHGKYQLVVKEMHYVGVGELLQRLEQLKREIHRRGWFAQDLKKPLPPFPKRIGVVTSPTGAAIQDMLNVLKRRHSGFQLLLNPVRVQGQEAAGEIAAAIDYMNLHKLVDVMIIGRGGGSIEDLWPFNEEIVAAAIHRSEIPIVAAVGHETDFTIADFVADVRAPTPSAAAEIVVAEKSAQASFLADVGAQIHRTISNKLTQARHQLHRFETHPLFASPYQLLGGWMQRCDDLRNAIDQVVRQMVVQRKLKLSGMKAQAAALSPAARIKAYRDRLGQLQRAIDPPMRQAVATRRQKLKGLTEHLHAVDPRNLVSKGYAILFEKKKNAVISSIKQVAPGDRLSAMLSDGQIDMEVVEIHDN